MGRAEWRRGILLGALALAAAGFSLNGVLASDERAGTVYRGLHPGGFWLELGEDGNGSYALSLMDGMPGFAAEPLTVPMQADTSSGSCRLVPLEPGVAISVDGCPGGSAFSGNILIGEVSGTTVLQPVGWGGSFVWGEAARPPVAARQSCTMQRLRAAEGIGGTVLQPALAALAAEAAALPVSSADPATVLPRLRADRLRAYSMLQLSPIEAEQARRIEDAIAGRPVLGRRVPMAEATQQKMEFDARVTNSPQRVQARQQLLQIDRALAEIYDVASASRNTQAVTRLQAETAPNAMAALNQILAVRQPARIEQLLALEPLIGELDVCLAAIAPGSAAQAHPAVRQSLAARAGELAEMLGIAMANARTSADALSALGPFENNQVIRSALQAGGQAGALTAARARVTQLAQAEEAARLAEQRAREEEERRLAAAAAALAATPSGGGGGRRFDASRVQRSVVFIYYTYPCTGRDGRRGTCGSRGSGFVVAPGVVVTNAHVVDGSDRANSSGLLVVLNGDPAYNARPATLVRRHDRVDMAIIRVPGLSGVPVPIAANEPELGRNLWVYGFPAEADLSSGDIWDRAVEGDDRPIAASLSNGIISRVVTGTPAFHRGRLGEARLVQYSAVSSGGGSGGPVFDDCHRVIAIHSQGNTGELSEFNNGVSTTVLPQLLRDAGVTPTVSAARC